MHAIHPKARTTPAVRAEIARSCEPTGVLAQRFGVSTETIRKGRKRGPDDGQDRSARPHTLPWKASEEERAIVCALRRATGFPLDDLTFVVTPFLPHLNRDAVYRILKAEGLNRLPAQSRSRKPDGTFKESPVFSSLNRSPPASSTGPATRPRKTRSSTSACPCTRSDTAARRISWSARPISGSSRCCSGTGSWIRRPFTPASP